MKATKATIRRIVQTCWACPSQWEGYLADGRAFYIRFRWGCLHMTAHSTEPLINGADELVNECDEGDQLNGFLPYDDLRTILARCGVVSPEHMESDSAWHSGIVPALMR